MDKQAKIILGLPLAGKTTWLKSTEWDDLEGYVTVSADEIREAHKDHDPENSYLLHEWSVKEAERMMDVHSAHGDNIIMDAGAINNSYTMRIIEMLKKKGYHIELIHIKTPVEICLERNKKRERKVPEDNIIKKATRETAQYWRLRKEVHSIRIVNYFTHKNLFIDMDGVLASYPTLPAINGKIDFVNNEYFRYLRPVKPVIEKLDELIATGNHKLHILSGTPNSFSHTEKNEWLDRHFTIDQEDRFFVNQGNNKAEMLDNLTTYLKLDKKDVTMIDDIHGILSEVRKLGMCPMHISEFLTFNFTQNV